MTGEEHIEEAQALLALLRSESNHEDRASLTEEVMGLARAVALWRERYPAALFDDPAASAQLEQARADLERWRRDPCFGVATIFDPEYPARLRGVYQAPPFLFTQGTLLPDDDAVAVVGSRQASPAGLRIAASVAQALVDGGWTVASGLTRGIDTAVHRAALGAGGRTVAVIGMGIRSWYPPENRSLQQDIGTHGLVLSQFWPDAGPERTSFHRRNATMSGYSLATVVVEACDRSGVRAQARMAVEHGRGVVLTDRVLQAVAGSAVVYLQAMASDNAWTAVTGHDLARANPPGRRDSGGGGQRRRPMTGAVPNWPAVTEPLMVSPLMRVLKSRDIG